MSHVCAGQTARRLTEVELKPPAAEVHAPEEKREETLKTIPRAAPSSHLNISMHACQTLHA